MRHLPTGTVVLRGLCTAILVFYLSNTGAAGTLEPRQDGGDPELETFPSEGDTHVAVGTPLIYATDPPTSGSHYPSPQAGGYFESPIDPGYLVQSMERGGVIVYYDQAYVSSAQRYNLMLLARAHPGESAMVVCVPRSDATYPIILTAWTRRLRLSTYDQGRIEGFVSRFLGQGPERLPASPAPFWPAPLLSRGKTVVADVDNGGAQALVDGHYGGASWRPASLPARVSIRIGSNYSQVLLCWSTSSSDPAYSARTAAPRGYSVEVSADSTDGADGTWTTAVEVQNNSLRTRTHPVAFSGQTWIRLTVSQAPQGVALDEIDIHGLSQPHPDAVFFSGDSITAMAFTRSDARQPGYAEVVRAGHPEFFPATINGGVFGDRSADGVRRVGEGLATHPRFTLWALGYGTNDAREGTDPAAFRADLQSMIDQVKAAGKIPVLARIPYSPLAAYVSIPTYNAIIDQLTAANGLVAGPDLYAWFSAHPEEMSGDGLHPTDQGLVSMNRLWAEALDGLYVPPPVPPAPSQPPDPTTPDPAPTGSGGSSDGCGLLGLEVPALLVVLKFRRKAREAA